MIRRRMMMDVLNNVNIKKEKLVTLEQDTTLYDLLSQNPIPLNYDSCFVMLSIEGENIPTSGTTTVPRVMFFVSEKNPTYVMRGYVNGLQKPEGTLGGLTWSGSNGSYFAVKDDFIVANSLTHKTYYFAKGNTVFYYMFPYNYFTNDYY